MQDKVDDTGLASSAPLGYTLLVVGFFLPAPLPTPKLDVRELAYQARFTVLTA